MGKGGRRERTSMAGPPLRGSHSRTFPSLSTPATLCPSQLQATSHKPFPPTSNWTVSASGPGLLTSRTDRVLALERERRMEGAVELKERWVMGL